MIKVPSLRIIITSYQYSSNTVNLELYEKTEQRIVKDLSNIAYVSLTTDGPPGPLNVS